MWRKFLFAPVLLIFVDALAVPMLVIKQQNSGRVSSAEDCNAFELSVSGRLNPAKCSTITVTVTKHQVFSGLFKNETKGMYRAIFKKKTMLRTFVPRFHEKILFY